MEHWYCNVITLIAQIVRPKVYVELGIQQCKLFNVMVPYAEKLIGVDIDANAGRLMQTSPKTRFVHGTTQSFAEELRSQPITIDMLFIDADHSKEAVLQDFRDFFPFVAPHGLIFLHDSHPGEPKMISPNFCGTAYQAVDLLSRETDEYEMMTIPVSPGLTLCRKRQQQLSWQES